ncbi:hypothetical protein KHA94_01325 [Bacillus sp. FJAT-49705]|uniref:Carbamoyl-phosphate synthase small subunit N-terminal domain-containing protein n=1 Tax=Cytobacillus citreus TaxID=2833586 RepID=A0ABS5NLZ7_9BACI|nr:carbamoyl-phosphate synthase domain-containing protein [Cytobacillus citreus]MBS4188859.1 hypothetical protein [Cytobacillus citreus]
MEGYLHLNSGQCFKGRWATEPPNKDIMGEIVLFTGMTGYEELLTDPSYEDKIVVFTCPILGNCGITKNDFSYKRPYLAGMIVYEECLSPSHYESEYTLNEYLQKWNIPMLVHMDTRAIAKKIRNQVSAIAIISSTEHQKTEKRSVVGYA